MTDEHILVLAEVRIPLDRIVDQVGAGVSSALLAMGRNEKSGTKKSRTLVIMQRVEENRRCLRSSPARRGTPGEREAHQRLNAALVRLRASYLKQQKG